MQATFKEKSTSYRTYGSSWHSREMPQHTSLIPFASPWALSMLQTYTPAASLKYLQGDFARTRVTLLVRQSLLLAVCIWLSLKALHDVERRDKQCLTNKLTQRNTIKSTTGRESHLELTELRAMPKDKTWYKILVTTECVFSLFQNSIILYSLVPVRFVCTWESGYSQKQNEKILGEELGTLESDFEQTYMIRYCDEDWIFLKKNIVISTFVRSCSEVVGLMHT